MQGSGFSRTISTNEPVHGPAPDKPEMIALIRAAVDRGVTFCETTAGYDPFTNEELVGETLAIFLPAQRDKLRCSEK